MIHDGLTRLAHRPSRPLRDRLDVGRTPGSTWELRDVEARETYEFLRPRPLGMGWKAIGPEEVERRLDGGQEVLVRETRSVVAELRVTDDRGGGMRGPRELSRETVETRLSDARDFDAFVRVNTGLPARDDLERLASEIDALAFQEAPEGYRVLRTGASDLEAARRLRGGEPLALETLAPALEMREIWTVVPLAVASEPVRSEADLPLRAANAAESVFQGPVVGDGEAPVTIREEPGGVVIGDVELEVRD